MMIIPINEKLFKKWATMNGYEQTTDKMDFIAQLERNAQGDITNAERAIEIIQQLQLEICKLQTAQRTCIENTLQAAANALMHQHTLFNDDPIIKTILSTPYEAVKDC